MAAPQTPSDLRGSHLPACSREPHLTLRPPGRMRSSAHFRPPGPRPVEMRCSAGRPASLLDLPRAWTEKMTSPLVASLAHSTCFPGNSSPNRAGVREVSP
ncbi:uncharacterized protein LOC144315677 isoform X2 [Canis aureus]